MVWIEHRKQEIKSVRPERSNHWGQNLLSTENRVWCFAHYLINSKKAGCLGS